MTNYFTHIFLDRETRYDIWMRELFHKLQFVELDRDLLLRVLIGEHLNGARVAISLQWPIKNH